MLKKYAPSLQIRTNPSRILGFVIVISHLLAILASVANSLPVVFKVLIILAIMISFVYYWKRYMLKPDTYTLKRTEEKGWELIDARQNSYPVSIAGSSVTTKMLTILHLQYNGRLKHIMVIIRDSVEAEDYRRLRVELKISHL